MTICSSCSRTLEERIPRLEPIPMDVVSTQVLEVITKDSLKQDYKFDSDAIQDDPLDAQHFVTGFAEMHIETRPAELAFTRSISGHLAEYDRLMGLFDDQYEQQTHGNFSGGFCSSTLGYVMITDLCLRHNAVNAQPRALDM
jgi:hypothetical protein